MLPLLRLAVLASLLATLLSTLRVYPHQLAYFNELSGGPDKLAAKTEWLEPARNLHERIAWRATIFRHDSIG